MGEPGGAFLSETEHAVARSRWRVSHRVVQHTLGEDEGIPILVQVSDSRHPWLRADLRILWMRFDDCVVLRLTDVRVHPHRLNHAIPSELVENDLWWCGLMDETHDHLMEHGRDFDPGMPPDDRLSTGWESSPMDISESD